MGIIPYLRPTTREPWNRVNGTGYVAACDGDYADAIDVKHFPVRLFMTESYGTSRKLARTTSGGYAAMRASSGSLTEPFMVPTAPAPAASTCTISPLSRMPS